MDSSIEDARREVQATVDKMVAHATRIGAARLDVFETELWELLLRLGRAVVVLFLAVQAKRPVADYLHNGRRYTTRGTRTTELGTRFGKVKFRRPITRPVDDPRGAADLPIDGRLGLGSGFSLAVVTDMARLCATLAFSGARSLYREFFQWAPSPRAVARMIDAVGAEAREFMEALPPPEDDGAILVLQVDARGAPMISPREYEKRRRPKRKATSGTARKLRKFSRKLTRKPRRKKGDKSKNSKAAFVGVIYTLREGPEGLEGPINKRLLATFESHEALFLWLDREARKRGYGRKRTLFLADGSEHIWRLQERYFPDAEVCLDWYHAVEHLWTAGGCLYGEGTDSLREWVDKQARRLQVGASTALLLELRRHYRRLSKRGSSSKLKRLGLCITYFDNNFARLRYKELLQEDFDIGTGAVEGAVRNLVALRLDGPGMRWGRGRSELVLYLRCVLLNDQWEDFRRWLRRKARIELAPQPQPAQPYAAIAA
jgi:hypothetical protein